MDQENSLLSGADRFNELDKLVSQSRLPRDERKLAEWLCSSHMKRIHEESVLLYAGCNEVSKACERMLSSGLGGLPAMGRPGAKDQPGTAEISALERLVERQLTEIFGGKFAEARLPSCTLANAVLYRIFSGHRKKIAALSGEAGGHISSQGSGAPMLFDSDVMELPFDPASLDIDVPKSIALLKAERPPLVIVGASVSLRPFSVREIAEVCHSYGAVLVVDVAHTAGLIAGGVMPNPLNDGADFMTGSTYKSLGGPPGAFLIGADNFVEEMVRTLACPILTSNYDASRLAALAVALAEAKEYMREYATAMIDNAVALASECRRNDLDVVYAPDNLHPTHQVLIRVGDRARSVSLVEECERAGIVVGANVVPGRTGQYCLRMGTQVVTRRGMKAPEMKEIAMIMGKVVANGASASLAKLSRDLMRGFKEIHFGFQ